jgi:hypothetical protein
MTPLSLPDVARSGLQELMGLSPEQVDRLIAAMGSERPRLLHAKFASEVAAKLTDLPAERATAIVLAFLSVALGREETRMSVPSFAEGVSYSPQLNLTEIQRKSLMAFVKRVLEQPSVVTTAKAWALLVENEHNFAEARVITDIRPVFSDGTDNPQSALIVHLLRITHGDKQGNLSDFVFALDDVDVLKLQDALNRAQAKSSALKRMLTTASMTVLEQEQD